MKYKRGLIFICFIICLFTITGVYASDLNETIITSENQNMIGVTNQVATLNESESVGTFTDLATKINNGGNKIVLDCDYRYNSTNDFFYQSGVTIEKQLEVDGKGHTIDGNGEAKLLVVSGNGVTLKNIVFTNICSSSTQTDGAVVWNGENGFLKNCSFTNISVKYGTTALSTSYSSLTSGRYLKINDCNFINNSARTNGNVIDLGSYVELSNCKFINNAATGVINSNLFSNDPKLRNCEFINNTVGNGGIIYSQYHPIELNNCSFVNNSAASVGIVYANDDKNSLINCSFINNAVSSGKTIYLNGDECHVINCSFIDNYATDGGAIYLKGNEGKLVNCSFVNNFVTSSGGSVYWNGLDGVISDCLFKDNFASKDGGAIYWLGDYGTLFNCSFIENSVSTLQNEGGAVRWNGKNGEIFDCSFINNSAFGGSAISLYGDNSGVDNCYFVDNYGYGAAGAIYVDAMNCILNNSYFENNFASQLAGAIFLSKNNNTLENCTFVNNSAHNGGVIIIQKENNRLINCIFRDNKASALAGAIYLINNDCIFENCTFVNNSANDGGAILIQGNNTILKGSSFDNNYAIRFGGATYLMGSNCVFRNNSFTNNYATNGGAILLEGKDGTVTDCVFTDNYAPNNGSSIYWLGDYGNLSNSIVIDNNMSNQIYWWNAENGNIENCKFINNTNSVINRGAKFSRNNISLSYSNTSFDFKNPKTISVTLENVLDEFLINSTIVFNFVKNDIVEEFNVKLSDNFASLCNELSDLDAGTWTVTAIFEGDDNYAPCNTTFTVIINPILSLLTLTANDTTVCHETILISNIFNLINSTVNGGTVTFFDGETEIGNVDVVDGFATLSYAPTNSGEHTITAVYNSNNYLSSNSTVKMLVDSASVEVLVNEGTVGFNSTFVANVKGLYSIINEGAVSFYINDEFIGRVDVVDGSAKLVYTPLIAGDHVVKAVFSDSDIFLDDETNATYVVNKADSSLVIEDVKCILGHEVILSAKVFSSNNLTVKGIVSFFDGETSIGDSNLVNGVFSLSYTPATAGEHTITAVYKSDNYLSSNNTCKLLVDSASVEVLVNEGAFGFNSTFVANVKGLYSIINEGAVSFYINDEFIGRVDVVDGSAKLVYTPLMVGDYVIKAVFSDSDNFLDDVSNTTYVVNKADSSLVIGDVKGIIGRELVLSAKIFSSNNLIINEGTVTYYDGENIIGYSNVEYGTAKLNYIPTAAGNHFITAVYNSENYLNSNSSLSINIEKLSTSIISSAVSTVYNGGKYLVIMLEDVDGRAIDDVNLTVVLNGKTYTRSTDANGQVKVSTNGLAPVKTYAATITFDGNTNYEKSTASVNVTVKKATPKITAKTKTFKKSLKTKKYTITLKNNKNKVMKNKKVTIKVNKKVYTAKTNSKGVATFKITKLTKKGTFKSTVTYKGDKYYNKVTKKVNIKVK